MGKAGKNRVCCTFDYGKSGPLLRDGIHGERYDARIAKRIEIHKVLVVSVAKLDSCRACLTRRRDVFAKNECRNTNTIKR